MTTPIDLRLADVNLEKFESERQLMLMTVSDWSIERIETEIMINCDLEDEVNKKSLVVAVTLGLLFKEHQARFQVYLNLRTEPEVISHKILPPDIVQTLIAKRVRKFSEYTKVVLPKLHAKIKYVHKWIAARVKLAEFVSAEEVSKFHMPMDCLSFLAEKNQEVGNRKRVANWLRVSKSKMIHLKAVREDFEDVMEVEVVPADTLQGVLTAVTTTTSTDTTAGATTAEPVATDAPQPAPSNAVPLNNSSAGARHDKPSTELGGDLLAIGAVADVETDGDEGDNGLGMSDGDSSESEGEPNTPATPTSRKRGAARMQVTPLRAPAKKVPRGDNDKSSSPVHRPGCGKTVVKFGNKALDYSKFTDRDSGSALEVRIGGITYVFRGHYMISDPARYETHPGLGSASEVLSGAPFSYLEEVDIKYRATESHVFVDEMDNSSLCVYAADRVLQEKGGPGCLSPLEYFTSVAIAIRKIFADPSVKCNDTSKMSEGQVSLTLFKKDNVLAIRAEVERRRKAGNKNPYCNLFAIKSNGMGICIVGDNNSKNDPNMGKNYRGNSTGLQIRFGKNLADIPGRKGQKGGKKMTQNDGALLSKFPELKKLIESGAKIAWDHTVAIQSLTGSGRHIIDMMIKYAKKFPQLLLIPEERQKELWGSVCVFWFGSNMVVNKIVKCHYDSGNFPLSLTCNMYCLVAGDGDRMPLGHDYCLPLHSTVLEIKHGSIIIDDAGSHMHAVGQAGLISRNCIRLCHNFYCHLVPPDMLGYTEMMDIGAEAFSLYASNVKLREQARKHLGKNAPTATEPVWKKAVPFITLNEWNTYGSKVAYQKSVAALNQSTNTEQLKGMLTAILAFQFMLTASAHADGIRAYYTANGINIGRRAVFSPVRNNDVRTSYYLAESTPMLDAVKSVDEKIALALFTSVGWRLHAFSEYAEGYKEVGGIAHLPSDMKEYRAFVDFLTAKGVTFMGNGYRSADVKHRTAILEAVVRATPELVKLVKEDNSPGFFLNIKKIKHIKHFFGYQVMADLFSHGLFPTKALNWIPLSCGAEKGFVRVFGFEIPVEQQTTLSVELLKKMQKVTSAPLSLIDVEQFYCEYQKIPDNTVRDNFASKVVLDAMEPPLLRLIKEEEFSDEDSDSSSEEEEVGLENIHTHAPKSAGIIQVEEELTATSTIIESRHDASAVIVAESQAEDEAEMDEPAGLSALLAGLSASLVVVEQPTVTDAASTLGTDGAPVVPTEMEVDATGDVEQQQSSVMKRRRVSSSDSPVRNCRQRLLRSCKNSL